MKAAEFLRGLADMLSSIEDDKPAQAPVIVNVNGSNAVNPAPVASEENPELDDEPMMIPPLQQKLELMKKMAGLPNQLDSKTAIISDEDEPFDG